MTRDLLITLTTKDRAEYINCLVQNLITQDGDFDVFIADMSTDLNYLKDNWLFRTGLERLRHAGHQYNVKQVPGINQMDGYDAGLRFAHENGYEFCAAGDDDIIYEPEWFARGIKHMKELPDVGICAGITLVPIYSLDEQTLGKKMPAYLETTKDFDGTIKNGGYAHCIFVPTTDDIRYYERVYGGYIFRTEDGIKVGGYPKYLSPLGFGGEGIFQSAIFFLGRKMIVDPKMISWHYQANYGGLRFDAETRARMIAEDSVLGKKFMDRGEPIVSFP